MSLDDGAWRYDCNGIGAPRRTTDALCSRFAFPFSHPLEKKVSQHRAQSELRECACFLSASGQRGRGGLPLVRQQATASILYFSLV